MDIQENAFFGNTFFEQFQKEDIADILDSYRGFVDGKNKTAVYACFMMSLACILCKDTDNAEIWRDRFRDTVMHNRDKEQPLYGFGGEVEPLIDNQFKEYHDILAAADAFLDVQISCFKLEFSSARFLNEIGLEHSCRADNAVLSLFFLVFSGWHYRYMNHTGFADARFKQAMEFVSQRQELRNNKFCIDLARGCQNPSSGMDPWAQFYCHEINNVCCLATKREFIFTLPECYTTLFKNTSRVSRFEEILAAPVGASISQDFSQLSLNQRLCCEIYTNRPLTFKTLNNDSLIIAADGIMNHYERRKLNFEQVNALVKCFGTYLNTLFYQLDLTPFASLIPEWSRHNNSDVVDVIILSGSNFYMDSARKSIFPFEDPEMYNDVEELLGRYQRNLKLWIDLNKKQQLQLSDYQGLAMISVLPLLGTVHNDVIVEYIPYITSIFTSLVTTFDNKIEEQIYKLRLAFIELYKDVIDLDAQSQSIFDHPSIMSVIIDVYKKQPETTKSILRALGCDAETLKVNEAFLLNALLTEHCGWKIDYEGDSETSRIWTLKHDKRETKILYLLDEWGNWDPSYMADASRDWASMKKIIVSPVNRILQLRNNTGAEVVVVLMSGVSLKSWGNLEQLVDDKTYFISIASLDSLLKGNEDCDFSIEYRFDDLCVKSDGGTEEWDIRAIQLYLRDSIISDYGTDKRIQNFGPIVFLKEFIGYALRMGCASELDRVYYTLKFGEDYKNSINIIAAISEKYVNIQIVGINNDFRHPAEYEHGLEGRKVTNENNRAGVRHYFTFLGKKFTKDFNEILDEEIKQSIERYNDHFYKFNLTDVHDLLAQDRIIAEATKAAKTAIMARNMSHNLGSHVLAYLKEHLKSVKDMAESHALYELVSDDGVNNSTDVNLPFMVGMGKFLSYLQERQDFIADVATDYFPTAMTLNLKDDIYDELNPDKRSERHPDRMGEKPDNILLGNIARSENIFRPMITDAPNDSGRRNDLVICFGAFDGSPVEPLYRKITLETIQGHYRENLEAAIRDLDRLRELNFSIPGGIVGRHAFFSIIENIIRNSAKHGKLQDDDRSLVITLDVFDKTDYKERASDSDNMSDELSLRSVFDRYYYDAQDADDLYFVTITDNSNTGYDTLKDIRRKLIAGYVDAEGKMREEAKGIKEMRICASWLRRQRDEYYPYLEKMNSKNEPLLKDHKEDIDHDTRWPYNKGVVPTLYVRCSNGHLQYIIALKKPMKVLLISDVIQDSRVVEKLQREYWRIMSYDQFDASGLKGCDYDFTLVDGDETIYNKIRPYVNMRVFRLSEVIERASVFINDLHSLDAPALKCRLDEMYDRLLEMYSGYEEGDKICIEDTKVELKYRNGLDKSIKDKVLLEPDDTCHYWYRTHYDTSNAENRRAFILRYPNSIVDGISGGNSSDRLVRCEDLDKKWFLNHLHAFKGQVAIFDERLSYKVYGIDGSSFGDNAGSMTIECNNTKGLVLKDRNIWIFNVVKKAYDAEPDKVEFVVYGMVNDDKWSRATQKYIVSCHQIASIQRDNNGFKVILNKSYYANRFNLVSIHQGLLDKLYTGFNIKTDSILKEELTKALYEAFYCDAMNNVIIQNNGGYYLPGMTIHSGRSRPASIDMPQKQPFIQYASLEHAVMDCKYVLVELLERAYYE